MDTEKQIEQLRLAASILETGHPFELKRCDGKFSAPINSYEKPIWLIEQGFEIRLALATPGDGRGLHNPDGLTAEQVGAGWRLCLAVEETNTHAELQEYWIEDEAIWKKSGKCTRGTFGNCHYTYRLPISAPWPEAPKVEAWKLPEPPAGKRWMLADKWTQKMLPSGYRPLLEGEENVPEQDETTCFFDSRGENCDWSIARRKHESHDFPFRTNRPLPVEPVMVALSAADVHPGSVLTLRERSDSDTLSKGFYSVVCVCVNGVVVFNEWGNKIIIEWGPLKDWFINRSIPLDGRWSEHAWEFCQKPSS